MLKHLFCNKSKQFKVIYIFFLSFCHYCCFQQEAVLDIAVEFKDGSMLPLAQVPAEEYELEVTSMNTDVVEVTEALPPIPAMPPSIKAIGNGKGEIVRVTLREIEMCSKKTIRSLDSEYVHVQVSVVMRRKISMSNI